ncbi:MAG: iron-containing redox enzyme family protein [Elusimicrobia bacterium]|nr:iron-containing redox enzyme family protein [Elusimicrobiota bacterium]
MTRDKNTMTIGDAKMKTIHAGNAARSLAEQAGYSGTVEYIYTADHPEVLRWTSHFEGLAAREGVFEAFEAACPRSWRRATVVSALWHRFSSFMPWFLCQAAAMVSTNEKRHYVIQTAFEELGMRDAREIHCDMFWNAAAQAGVSEKDRAEVLADVPAATALASLRGALLSYGTDEEVLGILLGLEIPARENIETVFRSLAHDDGTAVALDAHRFFIFHRQIEIEHVRLTVANFVRYCRTEEQRRRFQRGFSNGLGFWSRFWNTASDLVGVPARAS